MTEEAIRVEKRAREQAIAVLPADKLAAVQMPGQHEVIAGVAGRLPDARVVGAEDADMSLRVRCGFGSGDHDHPPIVRHAGDTVVYPLPPAAPHSVRHAIETDLVVVVATNREHGRGWLDGGNEGGEGVQL